MSDRLECNDVKKTLIGTALDASENTAFRGGKAVYAQLGALSVAAGGTITPKFSTYAEKYAYYRGKAACTQPFPYNFSCIPSS